METEVVNIKEGASYDIYIGHPSRWKNPFSIGRDGNRKQVVTKYEKWIVNQPELMAQIPKLKGKRLGCYCAPMLCHGNVLKRLADKYEV